MEMCIKLDVWEMKMGILAKSGMEYFGKIEWEWDLDIRGDANEWFKSHLSEIKQYMEFLELNWKKIK